MARRTVIGKQNDGSYGLRCSLPGGYDAYFGGTDEMSFDSSWTDISKIWQIGVLNWQPDIGSGIPGYAVSYVNPGYVPFVEIRKLQSGNTIYDDFYNATFPYGNYARIFNNRFSLPQSSTGDQLLYLIHQIAAPSG